MSEHTEDGDAGQAPDEAGEPELESAEPSLEDLATDPQVDLPDLDAISPARSVASPGERALTPFDPFQRYIQEIRAYPLLSREEEHELAVRYVREGDLEAARRLVTANLRLVIKLAHEYSRAHKNLLDLIQEGNLGLLQAVKKYDPFRGVKLSSYAAWWIRAYILKYILNNSRMVKLGTTQAQRKLFFNLRKERDILERAGFAPENRIGELARRLDVSEEEVVEMTKRLDGHDQSLDAPVGREDDAGRTHLDMLQSAGEGRPDVATERDEFRGLLREKLAAFAATLHGRELTLFNERLFTDSPLTLQEVGERYGITRERARQLEKRLTTKLREHLKRELGDAVEVALGPEG